MLSVFSWNNRAVAHALTHRQPAKSVFSTIELHQFYHIASRNDDKTNDTNEEATEDKSLSAFSQPTP